MATPFIYTETEIAAVLQVLPEAVRTWLRRRDLTPIALTSDGRPLFAVRDVEAIGRHLAAKENVRVLWQSQHGTTDAPRSTLPRIYPRQPPMT
jgi:hypothetical protein